MKISVKYFAGISVVAVAIGSGAVFAGSAIANAGVSHKSGTPLTSPAQKAPLLPRFASPPPGTVAYSASQALTLAVPYLSGHGSFWGVHQITNISYVKTTTNKALAALGPHAQEAEDSTAPAWLIVATGRFQSARGDVCQCTPPIYSDVGMVIVEGQPGVVSSHSTKPYSLTGLGAVVTLPKSQWAKYE